MIRTSVPVLIVGGGLAGLSQAVFLAWRGVPTVLVEKHQGSAVHPRAVGFTPRTLELFRAVGISDEIPQVGPEFGGLRRAKVESLAGKWSEESLWTPEAQNQSASIEYSPCRGAAIAQDRLEPILRAKAIELGADIRFGTELANFEQTTEGIAATLRNCDGTEYIIDATYLVAADGHRSRIREALSIGRTGRGHMRTLRSVLFRAPLEEYLRSGVFQFNIEQEGFSAFLTTYGDGRWVLMLSDDEERDENTLRELVFKAVGRSDLEVEIIVTGRWELGALIADRFSSGNVFLTGDAAHTLPPSRGGYGANTGIEDAHNLAWKLAAVISGTSSPQLLDTYDAERRPIAWLRHNQIFARTDYKAHVDKNTERAAVIDDQAMEFGQLYQSSAVTDTNTELAPAKRPEEWSGQPGTRAPHMWMNKGDARVSILDLFQSGWVLLAEDERWNVAAAHAFNVLYIPVDCISINVQVHPTSTEEYRAAFGLGRTGAVLVRPDGYIAWRQQEIPADSATALTEVLAQVAAASAK